jgi:hypothetical protein
MRFVKRGMLLFLLIIPNLLLAVSSDNKVNIETDEAYINFNSEEFSADGGVDFIYPDKDPERTAKIRAFMLNKIPNKNLILATKKVIFEQGENKVEAQEVLFNMDDQSTRIRDGVSYVKVEGAAEGNDRIYYGGEEFIASYPDEAFVKNAWFTTSRKALEMTKGRQDPKTLPYHMKSKKISIYPEDKIIAYNNILYAKGIPILWLPWYASSLKAETKAPLFPVFGSSTEDGSYIIWGFDYGHKNDNYLNGSFAVRKSSKKGWFIDSWENIYKIGGNSDNKGKLSLTDALVFAKGDYEEEYNFLHEHSYKGKNGSFNWVFNNQTINTINDVEEDEEAYENIEQKITRIELQTDLHNLGFNDDISIVSNVQYISNKEVIEQLVADATDDLSNDSEIDNDISSDVTITKDNRNYKVLFHYNYLDDIDPGSTTKDLKSFMIQREAELLLKKYKLDIKVGETTEDEWRVLSTSERYNGGTRLNKIEGWADGYAYTPFTIKKYDKESEENSVAVGPYSLFGSDFTLSSKWTETASTKTLSREIDPFREDLSISDREKEYHRTEDILYQNIENENIVLNLDYNTKSIEVELGNELDNYIDRSDDDDGIEYENESDYMDIKYADTKLDLYKLGTLNYSLGRREDNYNYEDSAYNNYAKATHNITLYDNSGNYLRKADLSLANEFSIYLEKNEHEEGAYDYSADNISNVNDKDDLAYYRLNSKRNKFNYSDKLTFGLGNTTTIYNYSLKENFSAYDTSWKSDSTTFNSAEFQIDDKRSLYVSYQNKEYYLKNSMDSNSEYYGLYNNESFRYKEEKTFAFELYDKADDVFKYSRSTTTQDTRDKETISSLNGTTLGLADRTTTYGNLSTTEETITDTYSYEFGEKKVYWTTLAYTDWENTIYDYDDEANSLEKYRDTYSLQIDLGDEKTNTFKVSYVDFIDIVNTINDEKKYILKYEYKDETKKDGEEEKVEFVSGDGKYRMEMTQEELEELDKKYREEVRSQESLSFDLMGIGDDAMDDVIYKRYFSIYGEAVTNEDYYKASGDFMKAVKYFQIRGEFHYNNFKLTYKYDQDIDFAVSSSELYGISRSVDEREHYASLVTKFGEPYYAWNIKGEITYKEEVDDDQRQLDSWKLSLDKEYDFIQYGLSYEEEWDESDEEYDWTWTFKIALTTFPEKGFGTGANYENGTTSTEFKAGI